jgi:hypothetical protein
MTAIFTCGRIQISDNPKKEADGSPEMLVRTNLSKYMYTASHQEIA